ncbi:MAG: hypothetical protein DME10_27940 [Candidatus Rokuibacteriota bacterium]|nr:MAG: hypothetical protein DME10_27940 [Candidatus Rokubacteria bacterium]
MGHRRRASPGPDRGRPDGPPRALSRPAPAGVPPAWDRCRGLARFLREGDRKDSRYLAATELARLCGWLREDSPDGDHQAPLRAIKLESPGSILYRQSRSGQNGCVFILNKFRSMRQDAEKETGPVWAAQSDSRVTRVGAFLRRTRLDELPQLFNVLVGHMSFIGPRPERPEFVQDLQKQIPFYMKRLSVKPGITGWAQVKYRYGSSVDDALEKLQYDLYYIKNLSLFLDFLILLNTVQVVLFARGR